MATVAESTVKTMLQNFIYPILPPHVAAIIAASADSNLALLSEIRLRSNKPLLLVVGTSDRLLCPNGNTTLDPQSAYTCTINDISKTMQLISKHSLYAYEQELKMGFLTIHGGYRVGFAGQAIVEQGKVKALKNISSLNIRLAREVRGCANTVLPYIIAGDGKVCNTLLISPPCAGKTTLLRDLIRQVSNGSALSRGVQVGVVDERSEIGACKNGVPTVDLGLRTDILDSCPKASGLLMLIRSMSPSVVATDELGRAEDVAAVREALHAGVSVFATVHGNTLAEVKARPYIGQLVHQQYFERYIILSKTPQAGTIVTIIGQHEQEILWTKR